MVKKCELTLLCLSGRYFGFVAEDEGPLAAEEAGGAVVNTAVYKCRLKYVLYLYLGKMLRSIFMLSAQRPY